MSFAMWWLTRSASSRAETSQWTLGSSRAGFRRAGSTSRRHRPQRGRRRFLTAPRRTRLVDRRREAAARLPPHHRAGWRCRAGWRWGPPERWPPIAWQLSSRVRTPRSRRVTWSQPPSAPARVPPRSTVYGHQGVAPPHMPAASPTGPHQRSPAHARPCAPRRRSRHHGPQLLPSRAATSVCRMARRASVVCDQARWRHPGELCAITSAIGRLQRTTDHRWYFRTQPPPAHKSVSSMCSSHSSSGRLHSTFSTCTRVLAAPQVLQVAAHTGGNSNSLHSDSAFTIHMYHPPLAYTAVYAL